MKTFALLLLSVFPVLGQSYLGPLSITRFENNTLTWSNQLCAGQPVYEVLQAESLTGPWQRVRLLTNQTSLPLTNPTSGAAFYRVGWVGDTPTQYAYAFDEGYGEIAVIGTLRLGLGGLGGSWSFQETGAVIDGQHPTGNGMILRSIAWVTSANEHRVRAYLRGGGIEGSIYLEGVMQRGQINGECVYTNINGIVYEVTFADTVPIGTFTATRVP